MSEADVALQRAIADACLGADAGESIERDLRGFLEARGVPAGDVEAALAAPARLAVYRSLVRNGLAAVVMRMLPRTRAHRDAARPGGFDGDLAAFVDQVGPRTHFLRDVPGEFVTWIGVRWSVDTLVPPYLADLAAHELGHFAVGAASPAPLPPAPAEIALDRPLAFADSMRLVSYSWAVHELPSDADAAIEVPARREVRLLGYRDSDHDVRWLELAPLAAAVLDRLAAGEPLGLSVAGACAAHRIAPAGVLADIARLLADLGDRGVVIGARAAP